ncbi:hypothetical protein fugu_017859 [Takifugu bimaculatus]|uniref:Ig-like domain-containing protein n=1 Tax=Takifugu bimaculatus TaxID=433685 RepID=A0A4Z2BUU6_9TELE|nr:hypothetical protein fugu_017859 [Takifugu bimaculatus]
MDLIICVWGLLTLVAEGVRCQGVYAPPTVRIIHSGHACNVEEERYTERVYTIREGETLELTCLVTGHPRPQIRWTKTAGSVSDRFQDSSVFNETLHIAKILRTQGGRYYCTSDLSSFGHIFLLSFGVFWSVGSYLFIWTNVGRGHGIEICLERAAEADVEVKTSHQRHDLVSTYMSAGGHHSG